MDKPKTSGSIPAQVDQEVQRQCRGRANDLKSGLRVSGDNFRPGLGRGMNTRSAWLYMRDALPHTRAGAQVRSSIRTPSISSRLGFPRG
ncbi:hypothetical protein X737_15220 [Mesorhizobium sp. L48C026A00]|nr:hypothetical protein X737_15220 [Mesorhizobium sp. L48C026A00]